MIYLDYSATTPVDEDVLEQFTKDNQDYYANPNSLHNLGMIANNEINRATKDILELLELNDHELIYTSGASESNNLAIKGLAFLKKNHGKHIITSNFEHASVVSCLNFLSKIGYFIDVVDSDDDGLVNLAELEELITEDTFLVSIGAVNSETGIVQDLKAIKKVLTKHPKIYFHSDMTQAIGKIKLDYNLVDLISFSAHKFYGLKGIGGLIIRNKIKLVPLIHGGKSTTKHRSGTPATPLMLSMRNALVKMYDGFDEKLKHVKEIHDYLTKELNKLPRTVVNSNGYSLNQIINISFLDYLSSIIHEKMSDNGICISTSTACGSLNPVSLTVKRLTGSDERSRTSVRVSISHLTSKKEIDEFISVYKEIAKLWRLFE